MTQINVDAQLKGVEDIFAERNIARGRFAVQNQMIADMDPFVPRLSGDLRTAVSTSFDGKEIYYNMQYANKQYHTHFKNYTTPGTGPYWDRKAAAMHGESWARIFVKGAGL